MTLTDALRKHWPEYLIEGWALGTFMVCAGLVATLLGAPASPVHRALPQPMWRQAAAGIAMGVTAIALIHSRWGKRSGAHMNPAVTLTFLRLGKIRPWDAFFFVIAQILGGVGGVLLVAALAGHAFSDPPVSYAATLPGSSGPAVAFIAEFLISAVLMVTVLSLRAIAPLAPFTGLIVGGLVATYITFESPLSGMSMNPARSFGSAWGAGDWRMFWVYVAAPLVGMNLGAFLATRGRARPACPKLHHPESQRCIFCGHIPAARLERPAVPAAR